MNSWWKTYASYHRLIWWIEGGTLFTRFTSFMVLSFMAIYMKIHTGAGSGTIGLALGCSALTLMSLGLVGRTLAGKYGRKQLPMKVWPLIRNSR
jgi:hypothetical protein